VIPPASVSVPAAAPPGRRRPRRVLLRAGLTIALVVAVVAFVDLGAVARAVRAIQPALLALARVLLSADRIAMGLKWRHLITGAGAPIRARDAIGAYYQSGFAALLLPTSVVGEVLRGVIGSRAGVPGPVVAASMVLEKLVAAASNLVLAAAGVLYLLLAGYQDDVGLLVKLLSIPIAVVVLVLGIAGSRKLHELADRIVARVSPERVLRTVDQFSAKLAAYRRRPRLLATNLLFNLAEHLLQFFALYVLARSLRIPLGLAAFLAVTAVVMLVRRSAGFLESWGLAEGAFIVLYSLFGATREQSVALALALWGASIVAALPGAYLLQRSGLGWRGAPKT
jgi:uncharacterized protein (TIRG00374 family)